ncbi:Glycerate dehydrogenase [bioreactor metagenome]|uniref:Glycerate dehydrogenase n=1 Tax=bioreactor metagenome TaxID=1076179 RepID=A0A645BT07_9ZZZZ|nr:2-hydroxyacid dehydrogenase [Candidatus Metalachnospira sp.]
MKISLLEPIGIDKALIDKLSAPIKEKGHEFVFYDNKTTDEDELYKRACDSDIVIIANNPLPNSVIERCDKLKMLDVAFTGIDHVGQRACKEKNVMICNAAGYSNETVSELVIGMAIVVLRKITDGDKAVRNGGTLTSAGLMGTELNTKTVGIVGTGRIGIMTAKLFKAFGCRVLGFSRTERAEAKEAGIEYVNFEELLSQSDIISLHMPSTAETKNYISKERIELMKSDAILINCARGAVVDNKALADALNSGRIAGAGIDVFDMEPPIPEDYPLLHAKNTMLTPHVAFASKESMIRRANIVFKNIYTYIDGKPENVVNY